MRYGGQEGEYGGFGKLIANPTFTGTGGSGYPIILAQSFVAASGAADANENALATITVPAGAMGANGSLRIWTLWAFTNSANNKTARIRFSGAAGTQYLALTVTTTATYSDVRMISNRGATNSQVGSASSGSSMFALSAGTYPTSAVDTTAATTIVITGQKASAGETITLEGYSVQLLKP